MFKTAWIRVFLIVFISQFNSNHAFDWLGFFDRWIFGPRQGGNGGIIGSFFPIAEPLLNEAAEKRFIDNEVHEFSKRRMLATEIKQNQDDIMKWQVYHANTNFIMKYIAEWALDSLFAQREVLFHQAREARENADLEPLCHHRYHDFKQETREICRRAFQHRFFQQKGWFLDDDGQVHCDRVTVTRIGNPSVKLFFYRETRRCSAFILRSDKEGGKMYFSVYLAANEAYLRTKRLGYFVLVNADTRQNNMKSTRFWKFWEEHRVQVAAYIDG